jgi:hypothetical protein
VDEIDGLERAEHHFEFGDVVLLVPGYQVCVVHSDAVHFDLKLKNGVVLVGNLANIPERVVKEDLEAALLPFAGRARMRPGTEQAKQPSERSWRGGCQQRQLRR